MLTKYKPTSRQPIADPDKRRERIPYPTQPQVPRTNDT